MRNVGWLGVVLVLGCATVRPVPRELVAAREAIERARSSPVAHLAPADLAAAERELAAAEALERSHPGDASVRDHAYVAWRHAERAGIAGLYAADLEALAEGRRAVERIRRNVEKRAVDDEIQSWLDERQERARAVERVDRDRALDEHVASFARIDRGARGPVLRLRGERLFVMASEELTFEGKRELDVTVKALGEGPLTKVLVWVEPSEGARGADAALLAQHRSERLRAELVQRGVPGDLVEVSPAARDDADVGDSVDGGKPPRPGTRAPIVVDIALFDHAADSSPTVEH